MKCVKGCDGGDGVEHSEQQLDWHEGKIVSLRWWRAIALRTSEASTLREINGGESCERIGERKIEQKLHVRFAILFDFSVDDFNSIHLFCICNAMIIQSVEDELLFIDQQDEQKQDFILNGKI